jgi:glucan-binding YG repeat protein
MKKTLMILIGILIMSCNQTKKEKQKEEIKSETMNEKSVDFDWLLGKWKRLNEEEGKETFENWYKINETEYSGIGFTIQNADTIKQEKIRLTKTNEKWNLTVKVPEEPESITFNGISHNETEFTCVNNDIDFPNKIKYWKNGDRINAMVSGGEMNIPFEFEKLNK